MAALRASVRQSRGQRRGQRRRQCRDQEDISAKGRGELRQTRGYEEWEIIKYVKHLYKVEYVL